MKSISKIAFSLLKVSLKFGAIGALATFMHLIIVWTLINDLLLTPLLANMIAYIFAFCISFSGNYWWTFKSEKNTLKALKFYFLISISAFIMNSLIIWVVLLTNWLTPSLVALVSTALVSVFTFVTSRYWAFKKVKVSG